VAEFEGRDPSPLPPRGILWRAPANAKLAHDRRLPAAALRGLVEHYWIVRWDLRGEEPFVQETLPHPSVHWVTENGRSEVRGLASGRFTVTLAGEGRVFGVKFRPGGFFPFYRRAVAGLAEQRLELGDAFGPDGTRLAQELAVLDGTETLAGRAADELLMELAERFLLERLPSADPQVEVVQEIVAAMMEDREITRVETAARRFGLHTRALQRLFADYVGTSPKWVIQRYRLLEAVERVAAGEVVSWVDLSIELGFFDQAHFIRQFKALVGATPADFARAHLAGPR